MSDRAGVFASSEDGMALAMAFMDAKRVLQDEAAAIHAAHLADGRDDYGIDGRIAGPAVAVSLAFDAMWQRPDVMPAIAAYFSRLAETRAENDGTSGRLGPATPGSPSINEGDS